MLIFTSIYGVVDGVFVSNFAGKTAFAAVNLIMPALMIFGAVGFMLGTGGSAVVARTMGEWYGECLAESGLYGGVDAVVPLPLHPVKRIWRGYNQSEYLAEGIAAALGVAVDRRSVRRSRYTASQALKPHRERAGNVEGAFAVRHPERLAGRHILLVDDVMTTGSTLASCAQAIVQAVPDCRISIAVLAVSRRELGLKE